MSKRLEILKTYKLYINGSFPRTESGRYYIAKGPKGEDLGNCCLGSRKDFRNAVVAARKSQASWAEKSAYNIGQVIYRIAENLESRKTEFSSLIRKEEGVSESKANKTVEIAIDRLVYFAGWSDKYQQIFSSVNPVASSHFNFSMVEARGVIAAICDENTRFIGLVSAIAMSLCTANTIVILASENSPLTALSFAEVLQHSDVPAGVVNILTGKKEELEPHFASHMDVNSLLLLGDEFDTTTLGETAAINLKRVMHWTLNKIHSSTIESPYALKDLMEVKTTWHPIEQIGGAKAGY
ncbi:MAG: aldehyde dehydrogenase family protein [Vicingaceae bacterium]